ncbi:MAG TPA: hypothetical protein VFN55_05050 [Solirubrobacteraceae bacterium]|nr:hypothetical protein [Solirubrobacteraceae bacterium]
MDRVLPGEVRWQPVAFAFILRAHDRMPWSFDGAQRPAGITECERRARDYGLPPMRWPQGWPVTSYGLISLRAAVVADGEGLLKPFSRAAFARTFVHDRGLAQLEDVLEVAEQAGLDPDFVRHGIGAEATKRRLTEAIRAGVSTG